jgi:hypothetical protein
VLRAAFPGADGFELEEAGPDVRLDGGPLEPLRVGQPCRVDGREAASERAEVANLCVNGLTPQVLQQVVVQVDTVERGAGRMHLVQVREIFVHEVREGFG